MFLSVILGSLAVISLGLTLWQWGATLGFPLHRRVTPSGFAPGVTLLKPLKGAEKPTASCLRSWFEQEYAGPIQILFGVESLDDPVCQEVRLLLSHFPQVDAELIVCHPLTGANAKVAKLAHLARQAHHDYLVVSDADVRVPPDLLDSLMAPFQKPDTGLVSCLYALANPVTLAMRWEAVAINADFWSQVLQSRQVMRQDFGLGAVMAMPRHRIEAIGSFSSLENYLADDYHLGHRIARRGGTNLLCPVVAECWSDPIGWREVWSHQLRWARTIRVCRPIPYALSLFNNSTWWLLLWAGAVPGTASAALALMGVGLRILLADHLQKRLMPAIFSWRYSWLVPVKDLLQIGLWLLSFLGSDIRWRGRHYRVLPDGQLQPRGEQVGAHKARGEVVGSCLNF